MRTNREQLSFLIRKEPTTSQPNTEEDREERIQRALNEAKKKDLEEKYGMESYQGDLEIEPEVEGEFLDYVEEFERQYQSAKRTTVRELVDSPDVKPLAEVPPEELDSESNVPRKKKTPSPGLMATLSPRGLGVRGVVTSFCLD